MKRIFLLCFLFFLFLFLAPSLTGKANAACPAGQGCFAVTCSPECNASTCGQQVTCLGYCPRNGQYCVEPQGRCAPCSSFTCTPVRSSCPCGSSCGYVACDNGCNQTISTWCGACTPAPTPTPPPPSCPTITCHGNSGAGGNCNPGAPNVSLSGCNYTCPGSTKTVPGYSVSVCEYNGGAGRYCYNNTCQCYPNDPNACNTGTTKTTEVCDTSGKWVPQGSSTCVANSSCTAGTATPTPTPLPNCTFNPACGSCRWACGQGNSRDCQFTQPQPCNPVPGFVDTSGCASNCPSNFNCVSNSCVPGLSISGNTYDDANVDTLKNAGESNYTGSATFQLSNGTTVSAANGAFSFPNLLAGSYTVTYTNPPTGAGGYSMTYPLNGPPPSLSVTVGSGSCSPGDAGNHGASCDSGGSVINLNFGITNNRPWFQCQGQDCRIDSGFISKVPTTAVGGAYASIAGSGGTPGLIFSGSSSPDFGQGQASSTGWVAGGLSYPENYSPIRVGGQVKTSYNFLAARAAQGNITIGDISTYCTGGLSNCTLSASIPHGIYRANGNLNLNAFNFPAAQDYVILVNGDMTINGRITVPVGSTAFFSTTGNITVDRNVGEAASSSSPTIQGVYSADRSFIASGTNNCATGADLRLNVAGTVITNAGAIGGSFQNNRDLCGQDPFYPTVQFQERADFILNTPNFLKVPNYTYQEIAP